MELRKQSHLWEMLAKRCDVKFEFKTVGWMQAVEEASKKQLRWMCKSRKLHISGAKKDLVARLMPYASKTSS